MIIKSVKQIEGKKDSFTVVFDEGTELQVNVAQIADFGIHSGRVLTDEEYDELRESLSQGTSKARAMRMLAGRSLSAREIEKRLVGKGDSRETAGQTVEWLEEIGMVDDPAYAMSVVSYYSGKAYGKARIRDELFKRGIDRELWEDAMSAVEEKDDPAHDFVSKKLRGSRDKAELSRAADTLCRRGFSYDEARAAVSRYLEELDEEE